MSATHANNDEQAEFWNGPAGRGWVEARDVLDEMLKPFENSLLRAATNDAGGCVLDVGCGTGSTTLAFSRLLGANGHCLGIDISQPMLAVARARARAQGAPAEFICSDAQVHVFEPASFDVIVSRFGVMFFADPVEAFANLRRSARDEGELWFVAWRSPAENPFMTTAERTAAPFLPELPARRADAPGQFAFADGNRIQRILEQSGWNAIDIQPIDVSCGLQEGDLDRLLTWVGPVGRILQESGEQMRALAVEKIRSAFTPYVHGAEIRFNAACWMVGARASAVNAS